MASNGVTDASLPLLRRLAPLERGRRLSQSLIWPLLRRFYVARGAEAWQSDHIPYFVTSNPRIADAYARVIIGLLRDLAAAGAGGDEPVYIVELATGLGRFGHALLTRLARYRQGPLLTRLPIKYVMTDVAERNLDTLGAHPRLRPLIEAGLLDLAWRDAEAPGPLQLRHSGTVLAPGTARHPMVFIANYLFDSLPQDAFRLEGGALQESLVTLDAPRASPDPNDPALVSQLAFSFEHRPASDDYYVDPAWNRLLGEYRDRLADASFLFPAGALQCLRHLRDLSGDRLLLLAGDKGYSSDSALLHGQGQPSIALHGTSCFSMMVDFQILGSYVEALGGTVQHHVHPGESLNISALTLGIAPSDETRAGFDDAFEWFGADDAFNFVQLAEAGGARLDLTRLLAVLRLSGWDSIVFLRLLPQIKALLPTLSEAGRDELRQVAAKIRDAAFPIADGTDAAFALGTLLLELNLPGDALSLFEQSVAEQGTAPGTAYNIALCADLLGQRDTARQWVDCALDLDPGLDEARRLKARLAAD